ncbi:MAG: hypothetical protein ISR54_07550 [Chlorobium phaeobacteroides]|uniref:Uncharacterized protein n=1 Tax=Chlorobium phaeobacteroides (strain BS1) TaxID=331678 RepID=B3EKC5_CHLPB|nr:hypothetical protein [Chlorobium phaeobacteroides]MBL6956652.1 hypothetical protein [Chlorobium phaeobacteroides]NEX13930.1 hypothetical protein [Prosthecochloris sp.]
MEERLEVSDSSGLDMLEKRIEQIVGELTECREQNALMQAEITSLQSILRSCKLPVSGNEKTVSGESFSYEEKVQVRQKLIVILQRIEMELRNEMPV